MSGRVHLGKLGDRDPGIDLGGLKTLVAEERLDEANVGAAFQHQGGRGVPEEMARTRFAHARAANIAADPSGQLPRRQRGSRPAEEQDIGVAPQRQLRSGLAAIGVQPRGGPYAHGNHAILLALSLAHSENGAAGVDVAQFEVHQLCAAHRGGVARLPN